MSLTADDEINRYYVDSTIGDDTVQHLSPGISIPGSRGIWITVKALPGGNGDDVQVQNLLYEPGTVGPPLYRAVKRIVRQKPPARDNGLMIRRSLLCMARANVSNFPPSIRLSTSRPKLRLQRHLTQFPLFGCFAGIMTRFTSISRWSTVRLVT